MLVDSFDLNYQVLRGSASKFYGTCDDRARRKMLKRRLIVAGGGRGREARGEEKREGKEGMEIQGRGWREGNAWRWEREAGRHDGRGKRETWEYLLQNFMA